MRAYAFALGAQTRDSREPGAPWGHAAGDVLADVDAGDGARSSNLLALLERLDEWLPPLLEGRRRLDQVAPPPQPVAEPARRGMTGRASAPVADPGPADGARTAVVRGEGWSAQDDDELRDGVDLGLPLTLLVEEGHPARRLYERSGFVPAGTREIAGQRYTRMERRDCANISELVTDVRCRYVRVSTLIEVAISV